MAVQPKLQPDIAPFITFPYQTLMKASYKFYRTCHRSLLSLKKSRVLGSLCL